MPPSEECVVELVGPQNENIEFPPLMEVFRGRWDRSGIPAGTTGRTSGVLALPTIPGIHICLNVAAKRGRVFDPLSLPEHAGTLAAINRVVKHANSLLEDSSAMPERVIENLSNDQAATWLHWMNELVKRGKAVLVSGNLERKVSGRVRVSFYDSRQNAPIYLDEEEEARAGAHPLPAGVSATEK